MKELGAFVREFDDIVFEMDGKGCFVAVWTNKPEGAFPSEASLLGKTPIEAFGPSCRIIHEEIQDILSQKKSRTIEYPAECAENVFYEARLVWRQKSNQEVSVLVLIRDVSEKKHAEETIRGYQKQHLQEKRNLEEFLDLIPAVVIWLDGDLKYKSANKVFAHAIGVSKQDLVGRDFGFSKTLSGGKLRTLMTDLQQSPSRDLSRESLFEDGFGGHKIFQVHAQKVGEGPHHDIVLIAMNVDEQRKTEKLLESERTRGFHSARLMALGEMAGGIAHEIKNPLSIISGNIELARREVTRNNSEMALVKLGKAHQTVHRIAKIVDGMTRLSRFSDRNEFRWEKISTLIDDALMMCHERMEERKVKFHQSDLLSPAEVLCLREQLVQILVNLLMNAIDAAVAAPEPQVGLHIRGEDDRGLNIEIHDNGQGVQHVEKLFNPFYTTKEPGAGTGLGLSISLKIAQAHEGNIHYHRRDDLSVFSLSLPHRVVRFET